MSQDNELTIPVEDFAGIDRNVNREDMTPRHAYTIKNMWEKTVGILETRGHSQAEYSVASTVPSNITSLQGAERLYRGRSESYRVMAAYNGFVSIGSGGVPAWISAVWDGAAYGWGSTIGGGLTTNCNKVTARLVGYGISSTFDLIGAPTANSRLKVTISSAVSNLYTGIELYAYCNVASSGSIAERRRYIWAGYIPLVGGSYVGDHYFNYGPLVHDFASGAADWNPSAVSFTVESVYTGTGNFVPGKTYYVLAMVQHLKSATTTDLERICYHANNVPMTQVVPITIRGDHDSIRVNVASGARVLICIGEHRQLLQPVFLGTNSTNHDITKIPLGIPGVVDLEPVSSTNYNFTFRESDFSVRETLCRWDSLAGFIPIFCGRLNYYANKDLGFGGTPPRTIGPMNYSGSIEHLHHLCGFDPTFGYGPTKYDFEQYEDFLYFVNDFNPKIREVTAIFVQINRHTSGTNYYMCGGYVAAAVVEEDYKSTLIRLPIFKKISKFQESIILTSGDPASDHITGGRADSSRSVYFSRAFNPFNFTVAGAGSPTYQFFSVELGGEQITGVGTFSVTTADAGPIAQFVIGKRNSFWMLSGLPATSSGSLESVALSIITRKAGCASHRTFVNTPIGLLVAAFDNVYLIRDNGEPTPIGDPVRGFIKGGDLTNAFAVFHDGHYKLSFYHSDYPGTAGFNNVELWLDVTKVKMGQGAPDWKGPMVGRVIDYCFIEDLSGDGDVYNMAKDRYCLDMAGRLLFKTDIEPSPSDTQILDFGVPVESEFESKDFEFSQQDNNWNKILKRSYWKTKVRNESSSPLIATEKTYIDGVLFESKAVSLSGVSGVDFDSQPLRLNPVFPTGRPRGRTVRKTITTTGRIGIGGFAINYQIERRRI